MIAHGIPIFLALEPVDSKRCVDPTWQRHARTPTLLGCEVPTSEVS
jgi:hypothetical protein